MSTARVLTREMITMTHNRHELQLLLSAMSQQGMLAWIQRGMLACIRLGTSQVPGSAVRLTSPSCPPNYY